MLKSILVIAVLNLAPITKGRAANFFGEFEKGTFGLLDCGTYLSHRAQVRGQNVFSLEYRLFMGQYEQFIDGYSVAFNQLTPDTRSVFVFKTHEQLLIEIDTWCKMRTSDSFADAVIAVALQNFHTRER